MIATIHYYFNHQLRDSFLRMRACTDGPAGFGRFLGGLMGGLSSSTACENTFYDQGNIVSGAPCVGQRARHCVWHVQRAVQLSACRLAPALLRCRASASRRAQRHMAEGCHPAGWRVPPRRGAAHQTQQRPRAIRGRCCTAAATGTTCLHGARGCRTWAWRDESFSEPHQVRTQLRLLWTPTALRCIARALATVSRRGHRPDHLQRLLLMRDVCLLLDCLTK